MKFHKGDTVRHIKAKHKYAIMGTPDRYRLESTNTPAYAYTDGNEMWVRCQEEMEDGRFELVKRHNAEAQPTERSEGLNQRTVGPRHG